jgi:hypothetical protein
MCFDGEKYCNISKKVDALSEKRGIFATSIVVTMSKKNVFAGQSTISLSGRSR